jgi:DNA-binding response OmpR family regulator
MFRLFESTKWPELSLEEIKKRARLLVVDDNEFPYKELFDRDEYNIDKWDDIENLSKLENGYYDIILLDIQGVGKSHSEEQGFGILKHLRATTPAQIVIAYSNADWSLKYQDFFDLADSRLDKRADYVEFKRNVDKLLSDRFSLGFYVGRIENILSGSGLDGDDLKIILEKHIKKRNVGKLSRYLHTNVADKEKVQIALSVVQTAIAIASI